MRVKDLDTYIIATTVSDGGGKFHPGIRRGHQVFYWENRKYDTEDGACAAAQAALNDAIEALNGVVGSWNLTEASQ